MTGTIHTIPLLSKILSRSSCSPTDQHPRCQNRHWKVLLRALTLSRAYLRDEAKAPLSHPDSRAQKAADTSSCPTGLGIPLSLSCLQPTPKPHLRPAASLCTKNMNLGRTQLPPPSPQPSLPARPRHFPVRHHLCPPLLRPLTARAPPFSSSAARPCSPEPYLTSCEWSRTLWRVLSSFSTEPQVTAPGADSLPWHSPGSSARSSSGKRRRPPRIAPHPAGPTGPSAPPPLSPSERRFRSPARAQRPPCPPPRSANPRPPSAPPRDLIGLQRTGEEGSSQSESAAWRPPPLPPVRTRRITAGAAPSRGCAEPSAPGSERRHPRSGVTSGCWALPGQRWHYSAVCPC